MPVVTAAKGFIRGAAATLAPLWLRVNRKNRLFVLMYHRVLPADSPAFAEEQPGMVVTPQTLASNMEWLKNLCQPVDLTHWVRCAQRGDALPDRAAAVTFDDGWSDTFHHAFPVLEKFSVPSTVFLCPSLMESNARFWPNRLASLLQAGIPGKKFAPLIAEAIRDANLDIDSAGAGFNRAAIDRIIVACKKWSDAEVKSAVADLEVTVGYQNYASSELMTWRQAREMQDTGLVCFGSHTRSHLRMRPDIDDGLLDEEIFRSRVEIEAHLGATVTAFAYPNGDVSDRGLDKVRRGYDLAVTTRAGAAFPDSDPHLLPRFGIHEGVGANRRSFVSRLLGIG